ncbi:hypothetical protein ACGFK1_01010 [Mycobacterium sp. NPDC048908]|uniref:hypothetical protein n=1 Tax=Mycobacterium sp. NPDC048908 TaxID=3364292 RepID=UPI003724AB4D
MKSKPKASERWALFGGLALTVSGIAHLLCPAAFEPVNRLAFKDNIRAHVLINGSIEAALGIALLNSRTRQAALAATLAYLTYFNASLLYTQRILAN